MRVVFAFLFSLVLIGCGGYKPVAQYSKNIFNEPVLVKVKIDPEDPSTGEYLQDEVARMAINRLNLSTTKNVNKAKGYILVNSYTINTTPETKDDNGNIIRYSINAAIEFAIKDKKGFWSKNIVSSEFVAVKAESSVSQVAKDKATKLAINKALDSFVLAVIQRGQKLAKEDAEFNKEPKEEQNKPTSSNSADDFFANNSSASKTNNVQTDDTQAESTQTAIEETTEPVVADEEETNTDKPLVNLVVVDDDSTQNGNDTGLSNENSTPTKILSY